MKKNGFNITMLLLLLCVFAISTAAAPENLYSYQFEELGRSVTVAADGSGLRISSDNREGTGEEYINFFQAANSAIQPGVRYVVDYAIETIDIVGTVEVSISAKAASYDANTYQLGNERVRHYISAPGVIEGSFTVIAQDNAAEIPNMLRSYVHTPAGTKFVSDIRVTVVSYETYSKTCDIAAVVNGQTVLPYADQTGTYMLLPAGIDARALPLRGDLVLSGENGESVMLTETVSHVDLEALLGEEMEAGKKYTLSVQTTANDGVEQIIFMRADGIPTLFIQADIPVGELNLSKDKKGAGTLVMLDADGKQINADTTLKRIKGRGNSTWNYSGEKKPYNIKLDAKAELIPGAGAAKDWCLLSDNCLTDGISPGSAVVNAAAFDMFEALEGNTPFKYSFINFYYNGAYRGVYLITEKVEIGSERVDITKTEYLVEDEENMTLVVSAYGVPEKPMYWEEIDMTTAISAGDEDPAIAAGIAAYQYCRDSVVDGKSGGILLELDRGFYEEASWFLTSHGNPYILKEPEFANQEQVQRIAIYVQQYEDALYSPTGYNSLGKYYTEYIDLDSLCRKVILDLATAQIDAFAGSCYFNVDVDETGNFGKLFSGPAWDYDASDYSSNITFYNNYKTKQLIKEMFRHGDFAARFTEISNREFKSIWYKQEEKIAEYVDRLTGAYAMNNVLWNINGENPKSSDFAQLQALFPRRIEVYYTSLFDYSKLLGITATLTNRGVLRATPYGTHRGLQWYKLSETGELIAIPGATRNVYAPDEFGTYFCMATGTTEEKLEVTAMISNPVIYTQSASVALTDDQEISYSLGTDRAVGIAYLVCYDQEGNMLLSVSERFTGRLLKTVSLGEQMVLHAYMTNEQGELLCDTLVISPDNEA